ncbi:MAG: hypothetical protein JST84_18170 [Acidobacteria bacterium]|nr:hypothetical protein [Acidobacteriota bacterium]
MTNPPEHSAVELLERVRQAEEMAKRCQAESAIYLDALKDIQNLAQLGNTTHLLGYFHEINKRTLLAQDPGHLQECAKNFLFEHQVNVRWLGRARGNLETIKQMAEELDVSQNSRNEDIRNEIIKLAEAGISFP